MKQRTKNILQVCAISLLTIAILGTALLFPYLTYDEVTAKVTGKERVVTRSASYYLVFTEGETLKNADSIMYFKFNSSDLYGMLKEGTTYKFGIYGWRIPILSSYRNIVSMKGTTL